MIIYGQKNYLSYVSLKCVSLMYYNYKCSKMKGDNPLILTDFIHYMSHDYLSSKNNYVQIKNIKDSLFQLRV